MTCANERRGPCGSENQSLSDAFKQLLPDRLFELLNLPADGLWRHKQGARGARHGLLLRHLGEVPQVFQIDLSSECHQFFPECRP